MSFLFAAPGALAAAASDLAGIGSTLSAANAAVAAPTTAVAASAADAVSAQVAAFLSEHGLGYQQFSAQIAQVHEQFVQTLSSGANAFAAAESNAAQNLASAANAPAAALPGAAQTLASAVNAPAATLLGGGVGGVAGAIGGAVSSAVNRVESVVAGSSFLGGAGLLGSGGGGGGIAGTVGAVSSAVSRVESVVAGSNFLGGAGLLNLLGAPQAIASQAGALLPTGGIRALTAASALVTPASMTNAAVVPAASGSIGDAIKAGYLLAEPYVQYGFDLAAYVAGYLPYVGVLAPQIYFVYDLFEPMVQAGLFNTIDWLQGSISFAQGLSNFWDATTASINQFINTEVYWALSFFPPLPPLPPFFP
jgi:PE family